MTSDLRCDAPHPENRGWLCRAKLNVAIPTGYEVRSSSRGQCVRVTCWRCGKVYYACPKDKAA